jgi:hypothetical protein
MAEVLAQYSDILVSADGVRYQAQACGAPMADGLWEGWIEFLPLSGGTPVRSPRETSQPNHADAVYWANGLTAVYLDGALTRALNPVVQKRSRAPQAYFDAPAPIAVRETEPAAPAVLNPFSVYQKGEDLLRRELGALSAWHLVNIIAAYGLSDEPLEVLNALPSPALIERIVSAMRLQQAPVR